WLDKHELGLKLRSNLTTSCYIRVVLVLNEIETYRSIAEKAGFVGLQEGIRGITELFEGADAATMLARGKAKPVKFDEYRRSYTLGKRKTISARVWIVLVQQLCADEFITSQSTLSATQTDSALEAILNSSLCQSPQIVVNNTLFSTYFPISAVRTRVIHPLKLLGSLSGYNIFAIVHGGGTSGQSGVLAHGIAKGLLVHEPAVATILRKGDETLRCDPRMVERKKPGLAKARKRVCVFFLHSFFHLLTVSAVRLGEVVVWKVGQLVSQRHTSILLRAPMRHRVLCISTFTFGNQHQSGSTTFQAQHCPL
ncbi:ribosomal protein S9/S16-domain-containing protein, partial [Suillus ampliporus]